MLQYMRADMYTQNKNIDLKEQRTTYFSQDDPAAFAYFQQELMSPRLQQALLQDTQALQQLQLQQLQQQQHLHLQQQQQQQQLLQLQIQRPSIMVPPQSPTLSSYYFENGWVSHYYDPKRRQYVASRVEPDYSSKGDIYSQPYLISRSSGPGIHKQQQHHHHHHQQQQQQQQRPYSSYLNAAAAAAVAANLPVGNANSPEELRESLLQCAHSLYSTQHQSPYLLTLLHSLYDAHPSHLPTILLLACVYYSYQDYQASLRYNHLILKYDPNYVEAMSNIGTTLRSMGKTTEAERWWYQAVKLRPGYWDAVENLVGVLCATKTEGEEPRYKEALAVCEFVEKFFFKSDSIVKIPKQLPTHQLHRLLNLFYAKGNLKYALGDIQGAQKEYEKGLELAFGGINLVAICNLIAYACRKSHPYDPRSIPLVLLQPDQAVRILQIVFSSSAGILPGLVSLAQSPEHASAIQQANQTTSTLLLTLAKLFQDIMNPTSPALVAVAQSGYTPTLSTLLPLYYLSLALHPSPSTANNLGIILSNISGAVAASAVRMTDNALTGTMLAMQYYMYGLQLDPRHPHLFTNLGSLLKDMGHLNEAINMYEKAVEFNPRFDVALANLGNAIKDLGRVQDSVQWYRRAVEVNPNFVDAVCGLVNSLCGVCDWRGRGGVGNEASVDQYGTFFPPNGDIHARSGWIGRVVEIVEKQLNDGSIWGAGILKTLAPGESKTIGENLIENIMQITGQDKAELWRRRLNFFQTNHKKKNEGGWLIRLIERIMRRLQRNWYIDMYGQQIVTTTPSGKKPMLTVEEVQKYARPLIPSNLSVPPVPTVLPFHTFTYPLTARQVRLISHRNALRMSHAALTSSWVPQHVYPPPPPPSPRYRLGYVSSDFNNHPLSHLMQSCFGFHDRTRFEVFCYATTPTDHSPYRQKIESEAEHFIDVSTWSSQQIIERIIQDGIHILVNLNGYTKGARNDIFAARPCPVQCSFMGFAGTLGGGWCDWIIADPIVCPPEMTSCQVWREKDHKGEGDFEGDVDPEQEKDDFVYTEKFIYMPHSYFVNDHKQGFRDDHFLPDADPNLLWQIEEEKRWSMRREVFPNLPDDVIIFANFNQLYKLEPGTFKLWLRILEKVPNAILWLLRFPPAGEQHLKRCAVEWAGNQVAQRVIFTDVAPKHVHIHRGRVADIFLDTPECNAHTTAADILWSGTPIVTYPKYIHKMCSRVGASIALATGFGNEMVVSDEEQYEKRAIELAQSIRYTYETGLTGDVQRRGHGPLMDLRKRLFLSREQSRLFDTTRWTHNLETGYIEAWKRWVTAEEFEDLTEPQASGHIWIKDPDDKVE